MLEKDQIKNINQEIYKKFPYLSGIQPSLKTLPNGITQLCYSASTQTANGLLLPIIVKAKITSDGKIINISTSK